MNYIISYECNTKNNCGYFGYEFSEAYIKQLFSERVRNKLIDAPGTNLLLDESQELHEVVRYVRHEKMGRELGHGIAETFLETGKQPVGLSGSFL